MKYRESEEMYLETIFLLKNKKASVRSIDIVTELGVSRPSVSRAVGLLQKKGYIEIRPNGEIIFTEQGVVKAKSIFDRHNIITNVLIKIGADKDLAEENACRFEHAISDELLSVMKKYLQND